MRLRIHSNCVQRPSFSVCVCVCENREMFRANNKKKTRERMFYWEILVLDALLIASPGSNGCCPEKKKAHKDKGEPVELFSIGSSLVSARVRERELMRFSVLQRAPKKRSACHRRRWNVSPAISESKTARRASRVKQLNVVDEGKTRRKQSAC